MDAGADTLPLSFVCCMFVHRHHHHRQSSFVILHVICCRFHVMWKLYVMCCRLFLDLLRLLSFGRWIHSLKKHHKIIHIENLLQFLTFCQTFLKSTSLSNFHYLFGFSKNLRSHRCQSSIVSFRETVQKRGARAKNNHNNVNNVLSVRWWKQQEDDENNGTMMKTTKILSIGGISMYMSTN